MTLTFDGGGADDPTTVLLLAPEVQGAAARAAATAFGSDDAGVDRVIAVTVTQSAARWLEEWEHHASPTATSVTCVDVDEGTRSTAAAAAPASNATVERVATPRNLERVGRAVSDVLQTADDDGDVVGLSVHSVSGMLRYVDEATAFKFVYTLGEVVRKVDGTAYFHLDPAAHDEETVETFRVVCDAVAELDCDLGARDVRE